MKMFLVLQICSRQFEGSELQVCDNIKHLGEGMWWVFMAAVRWISEQTLSLSLCWQELCWVWRLWHLWENWWSAQRSTSPTSTPPSSTPPSSGEPRARLHIYVVSVGHIHKNFVINETWVGVQSASRNKISSLFCTVSFFIFWVKANCSINTKSET